MHANPQGFSLDLTSIFNELAINRPIFHSEADFQHAFAWDLHRQFPSSSIRLERPIEINNNVVHVDIFVQHGDTLVVVELKYKTRKLMHKDSCDEVFNLRNQSAHIFGRYDFIYDIQRLEDIIYNNPKALGYAILLTNDSAYWSQSARTKTIDQSFRLHEGAVLKGHLAWSKPTSTTKLREDPISLRGAYNINWQDYPSIDSHVNSGLFRYLAVSVNN